jgi:hypothetical protein
MDRFHVDGDGRVLKLEERWWAGNTEEEAWIALLVRDSIECFALVRIRPAQF